MNLPKDWNTVREHFRRSFRSSLHVSIASTSIDGFPCATPIGSFFLNRDLTGFYFEMYPKQLPRHALENQNICVLGVDSSKIFWLKALYRGNFPSHPGIKLYGVLGQKRKATEEELARLARRMRFTRSLKGHHYLWPSMDSVREIRFNRAEAIKFGKMTSHL